MTKAFRGLGTQAYKKNLFEQSVQNGQMKIKCDVSSFRPEEVQVILTDNKLKVQARHEDKSAQHCSSREITRELILPKGVDPARLKTTLGKNGFLVVEVPIPDEKTHKVLPKPTTN